ncbi:MAG: hypothetical protein MUF31_10410 [Akkermansiaceae bacterium]|jgi:hypothetical protein|nr:hypothetical protein [Akkermansiaceae bacterium]
MPRRASSGPKATTIIAIVAALAALFFGGKFVLGGKSKEGKISGTPLDMEMFTENANSLRGNSYTVEGTIDGKLQWTTDRGQVISLKVDSPGGPYFLGIEIPQDLAAVNIEREQPYQFLIRIRDGGIAVAEKIARL